MRQIFEAEVDADLQVLTLAQIRAQRIDQFAQPCVQMFAVSALAVAQYGGVPAHDSKQVYKKLFLQITELHGARSAMIEIAQRRCLNVPAELWMGFEPRNQFWQLGHVGDDCDIWRGL